MDWQLVADASLMIVAVFFLFLGMSYFLFNPARKMLNDRRDKIKNELESARNDKEEAGKAERRVTLFKLKEINKEAEGILSEARRKAQQNGNQLIAEAKEEAAAILERARKEAELEKAEDV